MAISQSTLYFTIFIHKNTVQILLNRFKKFGNENYKLFAKCWKFITHEALFVKSLSKYLLKQSNLKMYPACGK